MLYKFKFRKNNRFFMEMNGEPNETTKEFCILIEENLNKIQEFFIEKCKSYNLKDISLVLSIEEFNKPIMTFMIDNKKDPEFVDLIKKDV